MRHALLALAASSALLALPSQAQDHQGSHGGGTGHAGSGHNGGGFSHGGGGGGFRHGGGFRGGGYGWSGPRYSYPYSYGPRFYGGFGFYGAPLYGYYSPGAVYAPLYAAPPVEYVERYYIEPAPAPQPPPEPQYSYSERSYAQAAPAPAPAPRMERITLSARELFAFDEATLRSPQPKLDEIAAAMKGNRGIDHVRITGYTDRIGSASYNQKLSERRANAVKSYLVRQGVEASRLSAIGKGKADPVVQCNDKKMEDLIRCLEPNRRVEVEQITIERAAPSR